MIIRKPQFGRSFLSSLVITIAAAGSALADGMYIPLPEKLPQEEIRRIGLTISADEIAEIANTAVAFLTPGCTSTFMSKDGLLGTNWHCVDSCVVKIQARSRAENGPDHPLSRIQETGYVAEDYSQELRCDGKEVLITTGIENVSSRFADLEKEKSGNPQDRLERVRARKEEIREECMQGKEDTICKVVFMNNEKRPYYLYTYKRITDVRVVWVVPNIIGMFGGMTDNWEYPRHCGDFAFLRVYDDGEPYHPEHFVPASSKGIRPGDPQFILGFPGSTERNITSFAAEFMEKLSLRYQHHVYGVLTEQIEALYPVPKDSPYGASWMYLENYLENYNRKADMIRDLGIVEKKRKAEKRKTPRSDALGRIETIYHDAAEFYPTLYLLDFMSNRRTPAKSLLAAADIWNWSTQPADDKDRSADRFKSWRKNRLLAGIEGVDDITTLEGEKALLARYFELADALPVRIDAIDELREKTLARQEARSSDLEDEFSEYGKFCQMTIYQQMAELLLSGTEMIARDDSAGERDRARNLRKKMFGMSPGELISTGDGYLLLAKGLVEQLQSMKSDWETAAAYTYELESVNHRQNLLMGYETPDANSTIRFTASRVQEDYRPIYKEGIFRYTTTLTSLVERDRFLPESAEEYREFLVPEGIKEAFGRLSTFPGKFFFDPELGDVPVNFITQHVITGGNSGSGVFNADGEIVGFAFDGTPESILSDLDIHPNARTIIRDIRYTGFLGNEVFPEAKRILRELGLPTY